MLSLCRSETPRAIVRVDDSPLEHGFVLSLLIVLLLCPFKLVLCFPVCRWKDCILLLRTCSGRVCVCMCAGASCASGDSRTTGTEQRFRCCFVCRNVLCCRCAPIFCLFSLGFAHSKAEHDCLLSRCWFAPICRCCCCCLE